jgi:hypothetical protein
VSRKKADQFLASLKPVAGRKPDRGYSVTTVRLSDTRSLRVWIEKDLDMLAGVYQEDEQAVLDRIKTIHAAYGREILEALIGIPGIFRAEITDTFGCGIGIDWEAT